MFAQRKAPFTPRSNPGARYGYRPVPIRARIGLAMRRAMDFGPIGDPEQTLRAAGLSLAPMSVGEAGLSVGGTYVLATAQPSDLDSGALKALVVPGGAEAVDDQTVLDDAIVRASAKGAVILAFGTGVAATLRALNRPIDGFRQAAAIAVTGETIEKLDDLTAVTAAAFRIG